MEVGASGTRLSAYLPKWVTASIRAEAGRDDAPFALKRRAAVLFLDLAGFTEQTETLTPLGARGAEELSSLLNRCFATLTDIIDAHGGDIVAFAGDGLIALWDASDAVTATQRAAACGLALQQASRAWPNGEQDIRQRISIEIGDVHLCRVGGFDGRWHYLVVGAPIQQVGAAYRKADIGQVMLCPEAWKAIAHLCDGEIIDSLFFRVIAVAAPSLAETPVGSESPPDGLERVLPRVVLDRATFGEGRWLAEFRNLTIVQIKLDDVRNDDLLDDLQTGILAIQRISARYEGTVLQTLMDDKGIGVVLGFGLPPLAHEEDPLRAIEAARAVQREIAAQGLRVSIGIATGRLFCGECGGRSRREYSVIGQAINLSSRLMEMAENDVLCDVATAVAVDQRVSFSVLRNLHLKGFARPVSAYRPEATLSHQGPKPVRTMVGRDAERARLQDALRDLRRGEGKLMIIAGEAGIGKSRLLADLVDAARTAGCRVLEGFATAIDKSTLYFAWREALAQLLDLRPRTGAETAREKLLATLSDEPQLLGWVPLLEDIVPLGLSETPLSERITGAARAASIEELIVRLLAQAAARQPVLLVFDDLHWFDGASLALMNAVAHRLPQIMVVATQRPAEPDATTAKLGTVEQIRLDSLSPESVALLVCQRLGATTLPTALIEFVHRRAGGNPFFCEELVLALRDTGAITVSRGDCRITGDLTGTAHAAISASVEGAVVSRIDALSPGHQMVLKVASAIGGEFSADMLQTVYPERLPLPELRLLLDRLVEQDLLRVQDRDAERPYAFRHAIIQEVTYDLLSFAQRRSLHKDIAASIERQSEGRLEPLYAQLAQHWELADEPQLAIGYLERAAEQALKSYANLDAIRYMRRATELSERAQVPVDDRRRSIWAVVLGDAHHELRDFEAAAAHYGRAMGLLGHRLPATPAETMRSLLGNAARQIRIRFWRADPRTPSTTERDDLQRAAHVYERLSEEYFFLNDSLLILNGTLASLNLAERCGALAETINGYNALALGLGMSGMVGAAHSYSRRASRLAEQRGSLPELARAYLVGGVLASGLGEWDVVERCAGEASVLFSQLGDRVRLQNTQTMAIFATLLRGDVGRAEAQLGELVETMSADSDVAIQIRAWALCARVLIGAMRGSSEPAALHELQAIAEAKQMPADRLLCFGVLAHAHERRGDLDAAIEAAERGLSVLRECRVVWAAYGSYGAAGVVDALVAKWEQDAGARARAQAACKLLRSVTRRSPVSRPRTLLLSGRASYLSGRTARARRQWHRAVLAAERLNMQHVVGLAWYELGKHSPRDDPGRSACLVRAEQVFARLGATGELARVRLAQLD